MCTHTDPLGTAAYLSMSQACHTLKIGPKCTVFSHQKNEKMKKSEKNVQKNSKKRKTEPVFWKYWKKMLCFQGELFLAAVLPSHFSAKSPKNHQNRPKLVIFLNKIVPETRFFWSLFLRFFKKRATKIGHPFATFWWFLGELFVIRADAIFCRFCGIAAAKKVQNSKFFFVFSKVAAVSSDP